MRVVFAECSVDYSGRLDAYLPKAPRLIMMKADGSVLIHSDGGSYKPLNWMSAPCTLTILDVTEEERDAGVSQIWLVANAKTNDALHIRIFTILDEMDCQLGQDPGLVKDGVEAHLQELLAEQVDLVGPGTRLVRREFPTAIGPVDLMVKDADGAHVAIEVKRRGEIDGVEQLTRYLELLNRDPLLAPVTGIFAAQEIKPQARVLAEDRGIRCLLLDYGAMKGTDNVEDRLF
ncbi:endonuclease NucS [Flaviflexus equikiangi]|uniref:Endonuclease NucS n=1 Tax=Flaviflexus equikiangi TaxID=2758573 RepID=A0ABS2TFQ4_9ACTO|nr:endonuclease NucS [Flaviflexus equikiangi]MBM9433476.1 endonuclease NucS [Flaviflexus equikiangi]